MRKLAIIVVIFLCAFLSISKTFAAVKKTPAKVSIDTARITVKNFNSAALKKFSGDKDFNYHGQAIGTPSVWERFWNWVWQKLSSLFSGIPYGGAIFKYSLLALAVAGLIYIVFKALGVDAMQLFRGEAKKIEVPYTESLENIHEINFDAEIEKAISQHNYRLAVRLLYLRCLKQLSDKNLIHWQLDKTNAAYLFELTDAEQQQTFGVLTRQFEYVWYGDFFIDSEAFTSINLLFQNFKKQLP